MSVINDKASVFLQGLNFLIAQKDKQKRIENYTAVPNKKAPRCTGMPFIFTNPLNFLCGLHLLNLLTDFLFNFIRQFGIIMQ